MSSKTVRLRHYTNKKGIDGIEAELLIRARDSGKVFAEKAARNALSKVEAETTYGLKKGHDGMSMIPEQEIEFPICGALRTFRAIEAVQQLFHSEDELMKDSWVEEFFQTYRAEISELANEIFPRWLPPREIELIRMKGVRAVLAHFPRKELPNVDEYRRATNISDQTRHEGFVSAKLNDLLRMYGMLEALIDLQETQRYKEVHELVRFGHEYYPELHALYYLGFSHWFSPDDIETIEEEGVDALLNDYPLPKRAKMASSGEGSTVKTLRLTGIQYRITESDSQVKESSDRTAGAKKSRTKGGANQPPSKKPKAAGSKKRTSGK